MPQRHVVTTLGNLPPGSARAFTVATRKLAFFNVDGRVFAIDDVCPHDGAPLSEGTLDGTTIICPWHAAEFDVTSGQVLCPPAVENVRSYPVFVNGDSIEVEL
ncbi:MAG: non-heme iron oxygenase ferredoxin subunit [Verrucomicrobia bacterium]|nr:non-heme iron oxygenase ferredoxin subunit [Verrucomicrobiota bacterium]